MNLLRAPSLPPQRSFSHTKVIELKHSRATDIKKICAGKSFRLVPPSLLGARPCLKFMGRTVRLRELPSVAILNQIEVKLNELLVVLFGNPLVDAVESEKTIRRRNYFNIRTPSGGEAAHARCAPHL